MDRRLPVMSIVILGFAMFSTCSSETRDADVGKDPGGENADITDLGMELDTGAWPDSRTESVLGVERLPPFIEKKLAVARVKIALHAAPVDAGYAFSGLTTDDELFAAWVSPDLETVAHTILSTSNPDPTSSMYSSSRGDGRTAFLFKELSTETTESTGRFRVVVIGREGGEWHADLDEGLATAVSFAGTNDVVVLRSSIDQQTGQRSFGLERWNADDGSGHSSATLPTTLREIGAPMIPAPEGNLFIANGDGIGVTLVSLSGDVLWSRVDVLKGTWSQVRDLRSGKNGSVWAAGRRGESVESEAGVVVRIDAAGNLAGVDTIGAKTPTECCPRFGMDAQFIVPLESGDAVAMYSAFGETTSTARTIRYAPDVSTVWDVPGTPSVGVYCAAWFSVSDKIRCLGTRSCSDDSTFVCLELWEVDTISGL